MVDVHSDQHSTVWLSLAQLFQKGITVVKKRDLWLNHIYLSFPGIWITLCKVIYYSWSGLMFTSAQYTANTIYSVEREFGVTSALSGIAGYQDRQAQMSPHHTCFLPGQCRSVHRKIMLFPLATFYILKIRHKKLTNLKCVCVTNKVLCVSVLGKMGKVVAVGSIPGEIKLTCTHYTLSLWIKQSAKCHMSAQYAECALTSQWCAEPRGGGYSSRWSTSPMNWLLRLPNAASWSQVQYSTWQYGVWEEVEQDQPN